MRSLNLIAAATLAVFALGAQAQQAPAQIQKTSAAADEQQAASKADAASVKAAFKRADTNGDGKLSREEAAALPAVAEKFTQLDKDGDGQLSAEEFETGISAAAQPAAK